MVNTSIERVKQAFKLLKESLKELEEVEYAIELLEKELDEYKKIIDKETLIPKEKFVKQRLNRLIGRMKYMVDETLAGVGIKLSVVGTIPDADKRAISNYIATYLDGHIRPSDMLFKLDDETIGIVFILKEREHLDAVVRRLDSMLLNLKAQTFSSHNVLINFKMKAFYIERTHTADDIFKEIKGIE